MKVNKDNFKKSVKRLEHSLEANGINLSYSKILDITSKTFGFKNYNDFLNHQYNENTYKIILTFSNINYAPMYLHQFKNFFPNIIDFNDKIENNCLILNISNLIHNDIDFQDMKTCFFLIASFFSTIIKKESFSETLIKNKVIEDQNNLYSNNKFILPKMDEKQLITLLEKNVNYLKKEDISVLISNAYKVQKKNNIAITIPLLKSLIADNAITIYGDCIEPYKYHDAKKISQMLNMIFSQNLENKLQVSNELNIFLNSIKTINHVTNRKIADELKKISNKIDHNTYRLNGKIFKIPSEYSAFKIDFINDERFVIMGIPSKIPSLDNIKLAI